MQLVVARLAVFFVVVSRLLAAEARVRVADRDVVAERNLDAAKRVEEEFFVRNALKDSVEANRANWKSARHVEVLDNIRDFAGWKRVKHAVWAECAIETVALASSGQSVESGRVAKLSIKKPQKGMSRLPPIRRASFAANQVEISCFENFAHPLEIRIFSEKEVVVNPNKILCRHLK